MTDITTITPENNHTIPNELLQHIKQSFTTDEQQLFVDSFVTYLQHQDVEFIIDFDLAVQWLQFSKKGHAKRLLSAKFTENVHYKIFLPRTGEKTRGCGHKMQTILLTVPAFKKFCLMANTAQSEAVYDYYIKLEDCVHKFLEQQLRQKDEQLHHFLEQQRQQQFIIDELQKPFEALPREQILYVFQHNSESHTDLYKIGETIDWKKRKQQHQTASSQGINLVFQYKTHNSALTESLVKKCLYKYKFGCEKPSKKGGDEWFKCSLDHLKHVILTVGACVDTILCFHNTISKPDIIKHLFKNIILNLYDDTSEIKKFLPDTLQSAFDSTQSAITRKIHKHLRPHLDLPQLTSLQNDVIDNVHENLNDGLDELLKELGF